MRYFSTRGNKTPLSFEEVLTTGLAPDGGLYMPETYPQFSLEEIQSWKSLPYVELVEKIITPFTADTFSETELRDIIKESYSEFRDADIAPVRKLYDNQYLLELFHGPTLAFKDFALQLLGRLLDHVLTKNKKDVIIIGATSGDTGSAAIEGCRHSEHVKIYMLHPHGKVSDIQRKQMTTVDQPNVFNIAIDGNFDDCQNTVKALFQDTEFAEGKNLVAVNSINWARIMAQIVYYFYAYVKLDCPEKVSFSVPTGNFGDVLAGYVAHKMGLPVDRLIIATNTNDILHRFIENNDYSKGEVFSTLSPSMDIQISSNFERLLFDAHAFDGDKINELMTIFNEHGLLSVEQSIMDDIKTKFDSYRVDKNETLSTIKAVYDDTGETLDPHTAIGMAAAKKKQQGNIPMITLATAHPAKFPDAIKQAGVPEAEQPECLKGILHKPEVVVNIGNDLKKIAEYIS
jgi:threonine synthase